MQGAFKGLMRGKMFDRSTPFRYKCQHCNTAFESADELDDN
jgi:hypothetical protein